MPRLSFGIALDFGSRLRPLREQLERQSGLLQPAEAAGFDLVAAGETSVPGAFHLPNALMVLASLAQRTTLRLCTGVLLLPAWPVWKLALDTAELDQLSGGRLVLGVGLGSASVHQRGGWPADAIGPTADETIEALRQLWAGVADYTGTHVSAHGALPILPFRKDRVPIWVGGAVRRSAVRAARLGDAWYAGVSYRLSELAAQTDAYRAALPEGGAPTVAINRIVLVARTPDESLELLERYAAGTLRSYVQPGESLQQVADDMVVIGTTDQIKTRLAQYAAAGATHVLARLSMDDTPPELALRTIELLGRDVLPAFAAD
jgi:alkanesulfonate monooxygenase SsuD/methylene tetrahydromethanopterin reductase-like flavin-dependent oxidoreductase (luciferase family)